MALLVAGVTGGSRGIGKAYVELLLSRGYRVVVFDKDITGGDTTNNAVFPVNVDVSDKAAFRVAFDAALVHFEATFYTVFVCNAGIVATLFDQADRVVQTNLMGAIYGAEMAIKLATNGLKDKAMCAPSSSSGPDIATELNVVITASTNGLVPADSDLAPVYVATKFALVGLVRSLQPLASRYNVRVNAIAPVTVETPMVQVLDRWNPS